MALANSRIAFSNSKLASEQRKLFNLFSMLVLTISCSDRNHIVRLINSACHADATTLIPLVHANTGDAIEGFPVNVRAVRE